MLLVIIFKLIILIYSESIAYDENSFYISQGNINCQNYNLHNVNFFIKE